MTGSLVTVSELAELGRASARLLRNTLEAGPRLARSVLEPASDDGVGVADPLNLGPAAARLCAGLAADPLRLVETQWRLGWGVAAAAWQSYARLLGLDAEPVVRPAPGDRRFRDPVWQTHAPYALLKQVYLLTARACLDLIERTEGLDDTARARLEFAARQVLDAVAPTNFAATNPSVLRRALETRGRSLVEGLAYLLEDLDPRTGRPRVSTVEPDAFELGVDLAATPGQVVYRNDLMELIQYAPATATVARRPLLVIPPWLNKYYVMDLRPENSLLGWLVEQGQTVFVISWVNPDESLARKGFEDYLLEGPVAALEAIERATGEREVNVAGYCLGGILLAAANAWLEARGERRVASATYLATMVDFSDTGEVSLFIDPDGIESLSASIEERGYLDGRSIGATFRALRANDLVWSFFVEGYLLGNRPRPFDILYWNADATNMPAAMHTYFMRNMYLDNRLREPAALELAGTPIDVTRVATPAYVLSTREDHIAPWRTCYESTRLFAGPSRFVLSGSGHIAGVINPPARGKYGYWTNEDTTAGPDRWLARARAHEGSWWPDWRAWLAGHAGGEVAARDPARGGLEPLGPAPGTYVRRRIA